MNRDRLQATLERHEGLRLTPYLDTVGKMTIGYGRNLDDNGITQWEAEMLLAYDIGIATIAVVEVIPTIFLGLNDVRQEILINMIYNLGPTRLLGFKKMIAALDAFDYEKAADEMLDSRWAVQVGQRAIELAEWMRTGTIQEVIPA